jgi:hypothetical protein
MRMCRPKRPLPGCVSVNHGRIGTPRTAGAM